MQTVGTELQFASPPQCTCTPQQFGFSFWEAGKSPPTQLRLHRSSPRRGARPASWAEFTSAHLNQVQPMQRSHLQRRPGLLQRKQLCLRGKHEWEMKIQPYVPREACLGGKVKVGSEARRKPLGREKHPLERQHRSARAPLSFKPQPLAPNKKNLLVPRRSADVLSIRPPFRLSSQKSNFPQDKGSQKKNRVPSMLYRQRAGNWVQPFWPTLARSLGQPPTQVAQDTQSTCKTLR